MNYDDVWQLVPELCIYEEGEPPLEGRYRIRRRGKRVEFEIAWRDAVGQTHEVGFGGTCDGERHATDQPGVATLSFTQADANTLDSSAFAEDGTELMWARRRKSSDGGLLSVVQRLGRGDGTTYTTTQVYRRG